MFDFPDDDLEPVTVPIPRRIKGSDVRGSCVIYVLVDPRDEAVRYVGKAVDAARRLRDHVNRAKRGDKYTHCSNWIKSLIDIGFLPVMRVVDGPTSDWIAAEQRWIAYYKELGAPLVNHTEGGEGLVGYQHKPETRSKISASLMGHPGANKGGNISYVISDATRRKMSEAHIGKGHLHDTDTKRRISESITRWHANRRKP